MKLNVRRWLRFYYPITAAYVTVAVTLIAVLLIADLTLCRC